MVLFTQDANQSLNYVWYIYAVYKEHTKLDQGMFVCACDMCMLEGGLGDSCENKGD